MSGRRADSGLDGILAVDKPAGWTSHDVVARVRGLTRQRRVGHTGTLDPMATGLLILCLGQATRLVEYMVGHDKRYSGRITLGSTTSTDDAEGEVIQRRPVPQLSGESIEAVLAAFRGSIEQRPPAFSAVKIQGRRAYDLARKGAPPDLQPRRISIAALSATFIPPDTLDIDVSCSSGTYIRSLARDIGEALECGAHLSALRRHRVGNLDVAEAATLEDLRRLSETARVEELLLPIDEGILSMDAAILSAHGARTVSQGGAWLAESGTERGTATARIYDAEGTFTAVASVSNFGEIRTLKVLERRNTQNSRVM